ncbi:MAG: ribosome biogenesis GTPase YlqF, partial [Veillonella sp.]|nr:ribosome biogenesis GTPase YlqF [Veillonella sp.]
ADPKTTKAWAEHFKAQGKTVVMMDSISGRGQKQLVAAVQNLAKPIIDRWTAKGIRSRSVRTIILGIPNVGKSTLINKLAGTAATRTADKAGHTRGQQWVRIGKSLELLDTPGILWPKLEDQRAATRLAITGSISDDVYDSETVMGHLLSYMIENHPDVLQERFKLKEEEMTDAMVALESIGRRRGCLVKGGLVDLDKARRIVLADYRNGKWGLISFDKVDEEPYVVEEDNASED